MLERDARLFRVTLSLHIIAPPSPRLHGSAIATAHRPMPVLVAVLPISLILKDVRDLTVGLVVVARVDVELAVAAHAVLELRFDWYWWRELMGDAFEHVQGLFDIVPIDIPGTAALASRPARYV